MTNSAGIREEAERVLRRHSAYEQGQGVYARKEVLDLIHIAIADTERGVAKGINILDKIDATNPEEALHDIADALGGVEAWAEGKTLSIVCRHEPLSIAKFRFAGFSGRPSSVDLIGEPE